MTYPDSAAVVKPVRMESASSALVSWLNAQLHLPLVSSALVEVEAPRGLRRTAPEALPGVPAVLARLYRLDVDAAVRAAAAGLATASPGA